MLESKWLYIWVDLFCIVVPFIFSFHPKIQFYKQWKHFWLPSFSVALFFIIWDIFFTKIGVWSFNSRYLLGFYVFNLPIEEILFFICIPYACVFTYYCVNLFFSKFVFGTKTTRIITISLILLNFSVAITHINNWYTCTTGILMAALLLWLYLRKAPFLNTFFLSYLLIVPPFLLSNGVLTGGFTSAPVVIYNNGENLNIRLFTIPIEDCFYGMLLLLLNVYLFETFKKMNARN